MGKTGSFLLLLVTMCSAGCFEKNTTDAVEAYTFWAGQKPSNNVIPVHGKYWQSSHWSKEYEVYLEIKAPKTWREEFVKQNHLNSLNDTAQIIDENKPDWFKPTSRCKIYEPSQFNQGSIYYEDTVAGVIFLHEVQL